MAVGKSGDRRAVWQAPQRPEWVARINAEARHLAPGGVIPLDEDSLIRTACEETGLSDFGEEYWREPFQILSQALDSEAELTLIGRLMARNDLLIWLKNRLQIAELIRRHPEIEDEEIRAPMFIVGLPRSGTSILYEILAQDQDCGVPAMWEAMMPCPPPEAASYESDPRIELAEGIFTLWGRVVPEFNAMHEMGGRIPAECGLIMASSFISDHICALHQTPSYDVWYGSADLTPAYRYHRRILQILQWKNPRKRWLLKAPAHQNYLDTLLKVYPDARIIQTHRDPIKCMASATNLMGAVYYMRSDKTFDAKAFDDFLMGEATARRLENVMALRERGVVPAANITDSRYQDLMEQPLECVQGIYKHFGISLTDTTRQRMLDYLAAKPKGKFGEHRYEVGESEQIASERGLFRRYQEAHGVPDEV